MSMRVRVAVSTTTQIMKLCAHNREAVGEVNGRKNVTFLVVLFEVVDVVVVKMTCVVHVGRFFLVVVECHRRESDNVAD